MYKEDVIKQRDTSIDILRSIAIIGIIIAHSNPNNFWIQLRGFDVILMVFLSAVCVNGFEKINYSNYVAKRSRRLILPVWIFLSIYFVGTYLFYYLPPTTEMLMSFTFLSDRYVWIIRILIILAMAAPFIYKFTNTLSFRSNVLLLITVLAIAEFIFSNTDNKYLNIILMTLPYGLVYMLGLNIKSFTQKQIKSLGLLSLFIFVIQSFYLSTISGRFIPVSEYKYPPQFYYMSYGLGVTLLLWISRSRIQRLFEVIHLDNFAKYVGKHTYWLYLWHIPVVDIVGSSYTPLLRLIIILGISLLLVYLQDQLVKKFVNNRMLISILNG